MSKSAKGKVTRIYPYDGGCYVQLNNTVNAPKYRYFRVSIESPNYSSLFSLALLAAQNNYTLVIKTKKKISSQEIADVVYFYIDFKNG